MQLETRTQHNPELIARRQIPISNPLTGIPLTKAVHALKWHPVPPDAALSQRELIIVPDDATVIARCRATAPQRA